MLHYFSDCQNVEPFPTHFIRKALSAPLLDSIIPSVTIVTGHKTHFFIYFSTIFLKKYSWICQRITNMIDFDIFRSWKELGLNGLMLSCLKQYDINIVIMFHPVSIMIVKLLYWLSFFIAWRSHLCLKKTLSTILSCTVLGSTPFTKNTPQSYSKRKYAVFIWIQEKGTVLTRDTNVLSNGAKQKTLKGNRVKRQSNWVLDCTPSAEP